MSELTIAERFGYDDGATYGPRPGERPTNAAEVLRPGEHDELELRRDGDLATARRLLGEIAAERHTLIARTEPPPCVLVGDLDPEAQAAVQRLADLLRAEPLDREALRREVDRIYVASTGRYIEAMWAIGERLFALGAATGDRALRDAAARLGHVIRFGGTGATAGIPSTILNAIERLLAVAAQGPEALPVAPADTWTPAERIALASLNACGDKTRATAFEMLSAFMRLGPGLRCHVTSFVEGLVHPG